MQKKRGWESESRASMKVEKDGDVEIFQGRREGERQMDRLIITNAIIRCYSSNLIVTQTERMRRGAGD